jgi:hypothetical protein
VLVAAMLTSTRSDAAGHAKGPDCVNRHTYRWLLAEVRSYPSVHVLEAGARRGANDPALRPIGARGFGRGRS